MRITPEQAARAVANWICHPDTDAEEVAAVFQSTFGFVGESRLTDSGEEIILEPVIGFSDEDLRKELEMYFVSPVEPIPDLDEWPEFLTDEILEDYGIGIDTLRNADDPLARVVAAGMDEDIIRERIEVDRIRTQKRCAG